MGLPLLLYNFDLANVLSKSLLLFLPQLLTHFISQLFLFTAVLILTIYTILGGTWTLTSFAIYPQPVGQSCLFLCITMLDPQEEKMDTSYLFPRWSSIIRWQKIYKPPPRFLNSDSNIRNSFFILANGWLNLNLHCS